RRLTASAGETTFPRLSPDGATLAFVGRDEGGPEVYTMPAIGGPPQRLTFLGPTVCVVCAWSADGKQIVFSSDAGSPFERETVGYTIDTNGGQPVPLGLGHARTLSRARDGRLVIGRNNDDPARWKRYRGGTAGDIWVDADGSGTFRRLLSLPGNLCWPMWTGERVAFLSDHEGIGNIYSVRVDGSDLRRHTNETTYFVRFPSTDGRTIVYTAGARICVLDPATDRVDRLDVATPSTAPQTARRFIEVSEGLEHFAPSPDGTALSLISRGAPVTMPLWEEAAVQHGTGSTVRYREAEWLHDGKRFVCVSDADGRERIELHGAFKDGEATVVTKSDIGRVTELAASPSADVVAFANHRNELSLVDIDSGHVRLIDRSPASRISDLTFSPDGRWLAYSCAVNPDPATTANAETAILRIAKVKSGEVHDVTSLLRVDRAPAWDPEGKYLFFISTRDFNPIYDALQFDLSFPMASRPFALSLRADVPSPFVPKPAPLHRSKRADEDDRDRKPPHIDIDFDGIEGRILAFPVDEGQYGDIVAARGRALFTKFPVKGIKPASRTWEDEEEIGDLWAYDFVEQRAVMMQRDVSEIRLAADHRTLLYTSDERMRAIDALRDLPEDDDVEEEKNDKEPSRRSGWLDLTRASVLVEPSNEWRQMYHEAWRMQGEQFWDEHMSGVDWDLVRQRYAALLPLVRTRAELSDLMWEMHGELGTSHAYEIGGDHREPPQYKRGFLGADLRWDRGAQGYRIERIYRGDSWDRAVDSPLAEPGLDVRQGDTIVAVGGRQVSEQISVDELLVNAAERDVPLTILRNKDRRRVLVRTLKDERMLRYRAWVEFNRRYVHERTQGRVGYLHIPDMGPWGFSEFHRGYLSEFNREALIVDVRYNRGGHVSPLLLEKLARKRVGYDVSRYGPPVPYPPESVAGPMVALTNQFAGSDGDIFSHCFKLYKLGPLIGKRTWGGVVGINPYHRLVDGTITTQPEFSFWFVDVGWGVENYGTDPDYDVDIAPHDVRAGHDPQMERALELIAQLRATSPNGKPHFDRRPNLRLPTALGEVVAPV
ncbi:MAG: PDZ domain-containing protein, partial [Candidatus Eremiobacteraeota bacterium]|nr:PDZ domain-containing protein [Candidatus Eremiobacteraeota bacterium]